MMIKNKLSIFIIIALFTQIMPYGIANAGLFDWLSNKIGAPILVSNYNAFYLDFPLLQNDSILATNNPLDSPKTYKKPIRTVEVTATAYSSTIDQTDDTPFITASGTYVRDGVVAANFLPIGTIIRIPDIYGDKIFIVEDRMNKRYWHKIDIWFPEREQAKEFGVKKITIEIIS
jgi:3D (Asp-Asp-Asp) domain-containing protein